MIESPLNTMDITAPFDSILLTELNQRELMRRCETKFVFHRKKLSEILKQVYHDYRILEINGERALSYQTTYFDTPDYCMYLRHHNGLLNRHKVRFRKYMTTDESFLEVKQKTNKGITTKYRIPSTIGNSITTSDNSRLIQSHTPYSSSNLIPKLHNRFTRITLMHKSKPEKVTIDLNLSFLLPDNSQKMNLNNICIVEVKRDTSCRNSNFIKILKQASIYPVSFSKYCMGISLMKPKIKHNHFKILKERIKQLG